MLNSSPEYDLAAKGGANGEDAVKPYTRTMLYREYNTILSPAVTVSPAAIDTRFIGDNVLNSRNPDLRGISYGPVDEFYFSDDPTYGYRFIRTEEYDAERDVSYYIPEDTAAGALATVEIDYGALYDMNSLQLRYDHTRNKTTVYDYDIEMYISTDGNNWTTVYNGNTNDDGNTQVFYNGTDWDAGPSRVDGSTVQVRYVRAIFRKVSDNVNPRVMYFGGLEVVKLDDDIISLDVNKTEYEQSTYLPYGESTSNELSLNLDNTTQQYRYGPTAEEDYFQKYQKITVEFGFDVSKYGGTGIEYVPAGTYYIEDFDYSEQDMSLSVRAVDFSIFLKERMCDNVIWENRSLKYIIKDVLARAGFSPKFCIFNFGISGNANESNKRSYIWSHDEQTVWDFLSTLIKSELGTIYFNEENRFVATDREYFRTSISNGVQSTLTADVDIESMSERTVIDANKVTVKYSDIAPSSTKFNPSSVVGNDGTVSYVNLGERYKSGILWSPSDDTFLGSTVLSRRLTPSSTHLYIPIADANQISEDEGLVRIGRELIKYDDRRTWGGHMRFRIVERGAHNTPVNGTLPRYQDTPRIRKTQARDRSMPWAGQRQHVIKSQRRGLRLRRLYDSKWGKGRWMEYHINPRQLSQRDNYDLYGLSFTFNKMPSRWRPYQAAGLFIHNVDGHGTTLYFEVNKSGISAGGANLVAYKGGLDMQYAVRMPPFASSHTSENRLLFSESGTDSGSGQFKIGTPIEIMVANSNSRFDWFVNGNLVGTSKHSYPTNTSGTFSMSGGQRNLLSRRQTRGEFGVFIRGNTDITADYLFATNRDQFDGHDLLRPYNPATNSFERAWLPETFTGFYEEFGTIVHEAAQFRAEHSTYPNLNPRLLNTLTHKLHVHYQTHDAFSSEIIVSNNDRYGVNINGTNFSADGTQITSAFLVYGIPIVTNEEDQVDIIDKEAVRKYGPSEVEVSNDWIDSKGLARSIAKSIRAQWKKPVAFFDISVFPNPAFQPGDRIAVDYTEKGFTTSDIWIVTGVSISYDGGLSGTLTLKRFTESPPVP